jgi:uncharacterized OsmC-like protein
VSEESFLSFFLASGYATRANRRSIEFSQELCMTTVTVLLKQQADYRFEINFGNNLPSLIANEPAPLGRGEGPSPAQMPCAAVGNCLSNSLQFALRKFKQAPAPMRCEVQAEVGRNPEGRLRILGMHATITLDVAAVAPEHLDRALAQFEELCTVTQSVR